MASNAQKGVFNILYVQKMQTKDAPIKEHVDLPQKELNTAELSHMISSDHYKRITLKP